MSLKSPEILYHAQHVVHCHENNTHNDICAKYWLPRRGAYSIPLSKHYAKLALKPDHSIHLMDKPIPLGRQQERRRALLLDVVIDARCQHSWPYNPFHRIADCLVFILPALYNFIQHEMKGRPFLGTRTRLALIVDESTEMLCEHLQKKTSFDGVTVAMEPGDICLLHDFQSMLRSEYYYQCVKISLFQSSVYWYKYSGLLSIQSKQYIWLGTQKNPWASGSGFMNEKDSYYSDYLSRFRSIMFNGFCKYCSLSEKSLVLPMLYPGELLGFDSPQNLIVIIERAEGSGRHIPQRKELLRSVRQSARMISAQTNINYQVVRYTGIDESVCETIGIFWSARVIIAAHGAGIVNTIFCRPKTLLIEITPDRLPPTPKGNPWRMNAFYANYIGLASHVVVVPHNPLAKTDGEIQKVYALDVNTTHIQEVSTVLENYLTGKYVEDSFQHISVIV